MRCVLIAYLKLLEAVVPVGTLATLHLVIASLRSTSTSLASFGTTVHDSVVIAWAVALVHLADIAGAVRLSIVMAATQLGSLMTLPLLLA